MVSRFDVVDKVNGGEAMENQSQRKIREIGVRRETIVAIVTREV